MIKSKQIKLTGRIARIRHILVVFWSENQKRALGRCRCTWDDNIKMDLKEIEWADGDYNMAQDMDL
jgi:hypothetical protein